METETDFIFLNSKITADGDCSHEIKRHLLLGRKAMTNFSSVQFSCSVVSDTLWPMGCNSPSFPVYHQHPEFAQTHVHWDSDAIQPSHPLLSPSLTACLQYFPASGSFPMSQYFASGGQSIGVSASASVIPMNIEDWFPLGLTGLISLQFKGLSRVFSVQKHEFFSAQLSL